MKSMKTLTTFLGWCTVINLGLLVLAGSVWMIVHKDIAGIGAPLFGVSAAELRSTFLLVLLQYRAGIVLFNLVPWLVLKIMGRNGTPETPAP